MPVKVWVMVGPKHKISRVNDHLWVNTCRAYPSVDVSGIVSSGHRLNWRAEISCLLPLLNIVDFLRISMCTIQSDILLRTNELTDEKVQWIGLILVDTDLLTPASAVTCRPMTAFLGNDRDVISDRKNSQLQLHKIVDLWSWTDSP